MDEIGALARGFAIGLAVTIPVGPIALLCMRRTLERGFWFGFATGLGAAGADLMFSALAAFGVGAIEAILLEYRLGLALVGGLFLLALAWHTAVASTTVLREVGKSTNGLLGALASGFVLTATNPLTLLGFIAIFAGFGVGEGLAGSALALALVAGVVAGSASWWLTLNAIVARIRHLFAPQTLHGLNLAAAALMAAFGIYELVIALMLAAPWLF